MRTLRAAIALSIVIGAFGACSLPTSGSGAQGKPCSADSHCDDANRCTDDACSADGFCTNLPRANAVPDDANDCTDDACDGTSETHTKVVDGTRCIADKGVCKDGTCHVTCDGSTSGECDDANPCTDDACDFAAGECSWAKLNGPTPGVTQIWGDCKQDACIDGVHNPALIDLSDPPSKVCHIMGCAENGTPTDEKQADGTTCGTYPQVCTDGVCIGCASDDKCPIGRPCEIPKCKQQACVYDPVGAGLSPAELQQTAGDCKTLVCDGFGNTTSVAENSDVPGSDNNECTDDTCINGSPQNVPKTGAACSTGVTGVCNNAGACVQCIYNTDCVDGNKCTDDVCNANNTCSHPNKSCEDNDPCTTDTCDSWSGCKHTQISCDDSTSCTDDSCIAGTGCVHNPVTCPGSYTCNGNGPCDHCGDGLKNGDETDVDCGGPEQYCSTRCAKDYGCNDGTDCLSGVCKPSSNTCE